MEIFEELGSAIEGLWAAKNYNEGAFPEVSALALAEARLHDRMTAWDVIRWIQSTQRLPTQHDVESKFGDPAVTLYSGRRFYIDIYFWVDGTTAIHQHGFDGAFQVLLGSSIHSRYSFHERHVINDRFLLGDVIFEDSELLTEGDIRRIVSGRNFIHALFHLDRPSATLTVRTYEAVKSQPQYSYLKPHIAFDPFFKEASAIKKLQSVRLLLDVKHADCEQIISDLLDSLDFQSTFFLLQHVYFLGTDEFDRVLNCSSSQKWFNRLIEKTRVRHGSLVDMILPVLEESRRIENLVKRRSSVKGRDHRFFLALILNVPNREKILEFVKRSFPSRDPVDTILDWVGELSSMRAWGSREQNLLGIEAFSDAYLPILECMLRGYSLDQVEEELKNANFGEYSQVAATQTREIMEKLKDSVFKGILAN